MWDYTSTNAVAAFGMVERPGCTMFYNMSVVAATPLAVRLLDAAYLAQLDPTLSLAPSAALLPYVGDDPPPLPGYLGSDVVPAVLEVELFNETPLPIDDRRARLHRRATLTP